MARDAKQEPRKTVWRGISVKTDNQPTSQSGRASISWERPVSPLSQPEHKSGVKMVPGTPKLDEQSQSCQYVDERQPSSTISPTVAVSPTNSTAVSSTKSSSKSSKHKKEKLANLGSLTKTPKPASPSSSASASQKKKDSKVGRSLTLGSLTKPNDQNDVRTQKERDRKERKDMEKQVRKERKDQEKLEKKRKEQQKKELKLLKEVERKERKSRTSSFLFSRSSKSSVPSPISIDTASNSTAEDKPKSPLERRSLLSFGRHSLASLTSKPSNASTTEIVTPEPALEVSKDVTTDADSSSDEFMDFVDSQMSIHSDESSKSSTSIPQQKTTDAHHQNLPSSVSPSPTQQVESTSQSRFQTRTSKLSDHLQQQVHRHSSPYSTNNGNDSSASITSSNSKTSNSTTPINTNHSMLYILNSLQDAGRDIEDDDLLDDHMANKMEESQQQNQMSILYQSDVSKVQPQLDQRIESSTSTSTERLRQIQQSGAKCLSSSQQHISGSSTDRLPTSPTISHCSSMSNSSYDTVSQAGTLYSPSLHESRQQQQSDHHWAGSSPTGMTDISDEGDTTVKTTPNSPIPSPITVAVTEKAEQHVYVLLDQSIDNNIEEDRHSSISDDIDGHQVDMNGQQNRSKTYSVEPKETSNPSSHLPIDETKLAHDYDESSELHITGQDQANETNNELSSTTKYSIDVGNTSHDLQLTDDENAGAGDIDDNPTQTIGNDEIKCDDMLHVIQQPMDICNGQHEVTETIQHSIEDSGEHDDTAPATVDKDLLLSAKAPLVNISETNAAQLIPGTQMDIIAHESSLPVANGFAVEKSPTTLTELTGVSPVDIITTNHVRAIEAKSLAMEAAAAVTASKRSTFSSRRWSATPPSPSPLEHPHQQQRPSYAEPPTSPLLTTTTSTMALDIKATVEPENGIVPNFLNPREQEEADQPIRQGMNYLFGNKFTKAMSIFKLKADSEPLYALSLGSMLFLKAMMTYNEENVNAAMDSLTHSHIIANTQADISEEKRSFDDTFSLQFSSLIASTADGGGTASVKTFKSSGVLRAHVIKAESSLLMGILQLAQENMTGYLKSGLNFKKACASYSQVWNEYQNMGDQVLKWMDKDTASGVQFGVGTLHLLLSSLPEKIVKIFPGLAWKTDRALGLTLLNSVMDGKGTRSSFGSLILLSYYSLLSSSVPSIYAQESIQPTIECLVAAQKSHPKSCFFLYYAARISRVARNVGLSTQSFTMATSSTRRGAWAEVAMKHTVAYEVGLNHAMQLDWDTSAAYFEQLCCARDWSPAFCQYFVGACHEMQGQRQEAIDTFDEVPVLSRQQHHRKSLLDNYVQNKVERHQHQNYRDLDSSLPGLELLLLLNAFPSMEDTHLQRCLLIIQETCEPIKLDGIYGLDDDEDKCGGGYGKSEKNGSTPRMSCYCTLLLLKAAVLNALSRYNDCITDLEWVLEKKHLIESEGWLLPFVYYESGVTYWGLGNQQRSRDLWQLALSCTKHDFEFRMASRIHLAMEKCDQLGIVASSKSTNGRKRF